ncbi:MAG TPA: YceI family protein [Actinomycetes bacterium]|jgi:polyisoprenoid-binding protein YceI|nr:YceI family protein [Actinomycetes bacterium]
MRTGRWWRPVALGVVVVAVLAVGGPYVFFHFVEGKAPAPLGDAQATGPATTQAAATGSGGGVDGTWKVGSGSQAGYRVKEVLFGQDNEAVGRTSAVSGQLRIQGNRVSAAGFSVDLTTVRSDQSRRDEQFQQRIMDTASYPTATFALTAPIDLPSTSADGADVRRTASGRLTLHGTTRAVSLDLTASRSGGGIRVSGSIPVTFADWNIPNPSFGPVTTEDHGTIEFLLVLERA